jgi:hypothetical protein
LNKLINAFGFLILRVIHLCKSFAVSIVKIIAVITIASFVFAWLAIVVVGHAVTPYIPVISPEPALSGYLGFYSGLIALGIIPLIVLVSALFRIIAGYRVKPAFRRGIAGIWIVTFLVFVITLVFTSRNFSTEAIESEVVMDQPMEAEGSLYFDFSDSYHSRSRTSPMSLNFDNAFIRGNDIWVRDVSMKLLHTESDNLKIVRSIRSTGLDQRNARNNVKYPSHTIEVEDGKINFSDYYGLTRSGKYRGQRIHYIFHIPKGTKINFSRDSHLLNSIDFLDGEGNRNENSWMMTADGLQEISTSQI